jgi:DNA modification methylase
MIELDKIYCMDAREGLKLIPDNSIDSVITSSPYWGLRDYKTKPLIWDAENGCDHSFDINERYIHRGSAEHTVHGAILAGGLEVDWKTHDGFCSKCNAWKGSLGLEPTPELFTKHIVDIFHDVRRVLKKEGTCWFNLGDSYFGSNCGYGDLGGNKSQISIPTIYDSIKKPQARQGKNKDLVGIPWRVAFALQTDGWWLRQDIIWAKPNPMPESVTDRCTKAHEYIFLLTKSPYYYYDSNAIKEPCVTECHASDKKQRDLLKGNVQIDGNEQHHSGNILYGRMPPIGGVKKSGGDNPTYSGNTPLWTGLRNKRDVWTITTKPFKSAHFATFPEDLVEPMIKAGCPEEGTILDPFIGAGTTGVVARRLGRHFIGFELNPDYVALANKRLMA